MVQGASVQSPNASVVCVAHTRQWSMGTSSSQACWAILNWPFLASSPFLPLQLNLSKVRALHGDQLCTYGVAAGGGGGFVETHEVGTMLHCFSNAHKKTLMCGCT